MVQSTLPGWHTPIIKVEIAFDFTKVYASMPPGQTFKWYGNRSDETVARGFIKLIVVPKLVLGLLIIQKHSPRWCPLSSPVLLLACIQHIRNISNRIYFSWKVLDITVWYNAYNLTSNSQCWILFILIPDACEIFIFGICLRRTPPACHPLLHALSQIILRFHLHDIGKILVPGSYFLAKLLFG